VDAWVRITGVVVGTYLYGERRQLVAPRLDVRSTSDLEIKRPAAPDPFAMPTLAVSQLLNFDPGGISVHRVKVRGVVTHQQMSRALFLRDGNRGLYVQTRRAEVARPGEIVEVLGFPAMGQFSVFLEDAVYRKVGSEAEPRPVLTNARRELRGTNDANLVSLEARILDILRLPAESVLVLSADEMIFNGRLPAGPFDVRTGSRVRLAGICRIKDPGNQGFEISSGPRSVEILLRSQADVAVLDAPSWWTVPRLAGLIGVLLVVALAAFTWVALLGRRVTEQTEVIRKKIEREAMLEERHRMAREIHDALAQSFSGLDFQLEALGIQLPADSARAREQLETAKKMVRHGQEEFRRSLTNLRAQELERGGLVEALTELGGQMAAGSGVAFEVKCSGNARGLNEGVENNLLRIGQECITNAIRHAKAGHINAQVEFAPEAVKLSVADDGAGFDTGKLERLDPNHFGWRGIQERAEQIGAEVKLISQPGHGTKVVIVVPI
jgi:signal transduction histidine kinase